MGLSHEVKYIQDIVCKKDLNYYTLYRFSWCDSPFLMQFWEHLLYQQHPLSVLQIRDYLL